MIYWISVRSEVVTVTAWKKNLKPFAKKWNGHVYTTTPKAIVSEALETIVDN